MRHLQWSLERILRRLAGRVLTRYHPHVIGVTGSVGKTTTVQACGLVFGPGVRVSPKNYNNEIGVPLAVLGLRSGGRSIFAWVRVLAAAARLAYGPALAYPKRLVLELGADKPDDIATLVAWLQPRVAVVTWISAAHLERFGSLEALAAEKGQVVARLPAAGIAILNADNPLVLALRSQTRAQVVTFGFGPHAEVRAHAVDVVAEPLTDRYRYGGMRCEIVWQGQAAQVHLHNVVGQETLYAVLAAVALGLSQGMSVAAAVAPLANFLPPPGRLRLIAGVKGTMMIDSSYNSSPAAAQAAVRTLATLPTGAGRKFAVLGEMLALGSLAGQAHRELGGQVARANLDYLVTVGELARDIARGAADAGFAEDRRFSFATAREAGQFLQGRIRPGDLLLIKGSQAVRMERVVKELMAEPLRAGELLVRQGPEWQ